MTARRWIHAAALAASLAAGPPRAARAQAAPAPAGTPAPPVDVSALVARDLGCLRDRLDRAAPATRPADEAPAQALRDEAARRLLARPAPEARAVLLRALADPAAPRDAKLAVARAVADDPRPDARFAPALLPLLGSPERGLNDAVARALARFGYEPAIRQRLIDFARDPRQPAAQRVAVIRALQEVVARDVAAALFALMTDAAQAAAVRNAAADALGELTGLVGNGRDAGRWRQWFAANASKPEVVWRADVLATRDAHLGRGRREQAGFAAELQAVLLEQYQRADRDARFALVIRLLNAADPQARALGVGLVAEAHANAQPFPPGARERLKDLVGDGDPAVRKAAAQAINAINDTGAFHAVLAQLAQEPNDDVKVELVNALVPMGNLGAVPELRSLLRDPSLKVATAAAKALQKLAPALFRADPTTAQRTADELWQVGDQRQNEPGGGADFRAVTIEAVGPLHSRRLTADLLGLLNADQPERVRGAALRALGELGDPQTAFRISQWLAEEPSADVRADAVAALGATGTFGAIADTLYRRTSPNVEPSEKVRNAAWDVFVSKLPSAETVEMLSQWAANLQGDPARELPVLLELDRRLLKDVGDAKLSPAERRDRLERLANFRQSTGEVYASLKPPDPERAAAYFRGALENYRELGIANARTGQLFAQLTKALLDGRKYAEATAFAAREIRADPRQQDVMGPDIRDAANLLTDQGVQKNDPQKLNDALALIKAALAMDPPLDERYQRDLLDFRQQIERRSPAPPR